ncbi:HEPN domain-containing protein [Seonamhaeicola algicola]|uniref:HEPN domain-containing protein n=2 Tax=Seonamhaeicola TaxID=1649495 RepID=A0A5C7B9M6_9FLAO|nr:MULTISPECIES: HEPN domain-containing protein [Seonamhaeicola]TXE15278.1 HEPN domain-containing protein [Seonamhaeicola algicola]TYA73281.1 HEPN domain-containing protein [Seonamhaeicola marinus]
MKKANYLGLSYQFWTLTKEAINEMKKQENKKLIMSKYDPNQTDEESHEEYYQKTKWNDFNVGVPILYNFYHGLELCMKGLLQEINKFPTSKKTHSLTSYFEIIKENKKSFIPEIIHSIDKVLNNENSFSSFFESNNSNVDSYYQLLRYPESYKGNEIYFHGEIRGKEKIGLKNFESIYKSCVDIEKSIIKWFEKT